MNHAPPRPPLSTGRARSPQNDGENQSGLACRTRPRSNRIAPYPLSSRNGVSPSVASYPVIVRSLAIHVPTAPQSICLLRLSALADVTHVGPLVRTLQAAWPNLRLSWVIGRGEHRLLDGLPGVDFIEYDKKTGLAGMRALRRDLRARLGADRRFDAL